MRPGDMLRNARFGGNWSGDVLPSTAITIPL
jgi:hypothetical protein